MKIFQESVGLYLLYVILIGICLGLIFVSFNPSSILLRWLCPPSAGQPTRTALLNRNELQLSDHCFPPDNVDDDHGDDDKEEEEVWWRLVERSLQQGASYLKKIVLWSVVVTVVLLGSDTHVANLGASWSHFLPVTLIMVCRGYGRCGRGRHGQGHCSRGHHC